MLIKEVFDKSIEREIKKVVIAGTTDDPKIEEELEEYVITRQLRQYFADFFEFYKKGIVGNTEEVGVWISGFFGSGKSHFLNVLSYVLSNKTIQGKGIVDYLHDTDKINDPMVLADMKLAADTPTDVILFDIDAKGGNSSDHKRETIVNVFLRVFNDMQGFCGALPYVADLEANLSEEGRYEEFKTAFEEEYGKPWVESRNKFDFIQDDVVDVLVEMNYMSEAAARNWCEKTTTDYEITLDEFGDRVQKYIESKGNNHHIVFMVDELGQYIGDDSKLMLNVQTLRHQLSVKCDGKAWLIVTSQQDVDSIMQVKGNDFSKIQGRFKTLPLSSANVDEVIKKRLLKKKDTPAQSLRLMFEQYSTPIKNNITFNDQVEKKLYSNADDFAAVYPFVPYHFKVLSLVMNSIRVHGASGKSVSEGERSMLELFTSAAKKSKDKEIGFLIPFDYFYDALADKLDHSHSSVIIKAYDNSKINPEHKTDNVFAINVLKTLFMIKYVPEVESNLENITSLMISDVNDDRIALREKVIESLYVLEKQMLIQKNGDLYIFLTNEEQEIRREIDNQNVEVSEIINKAAELIFAGVLTDDKYRYPEFNGRYNFRFNQFVDDRPYKSNQNFDIGLRIITPWYDGLRNDSVLRMASGERKEVLVALPNDAAFLEEIRTYLKIWKFLRLNSDSQLTKYDSIIEATKKELNERNNNAKIYLKDNLSDSEIYVNGDTLKTSSKEIIGRIGEAMGKLVQSVYHKLSYIDRAFDESDIRKVLQSSNQVSAFLDGGVEPNNNALMDLLAYVAQNSNHASVSIKSIKERFMKAPYGFVEDDVSWIVARLFKRGDLAFKVNGVSVSLNNKSEDDILGYITKKAFAEKLMIEERIRVSEKDKKAVRDVMKELFGTSAVSDEEDTIMSNFQRYAQNTINDIIRLESQYDKYPYPGRSILSDGKKLMQSAIQFQDAVDFFQSISNNRDVYLEFADAYEPIKTFFSGKQQEIFSHAIDLLRIYDDSKTYIVDSKLESTVDQIRTITNQDSPYSNIYRLPELTDSFSESYLKILEKEEIPVVDSIKSSRDRVIEVLSTKEYCDEYKNKYWSLFEEILDGVKHCNNVSTLRGYSDRADALRIRLLNDIDAIDARLEQEKAAEVASESDGASSDAVNPKGPVVTPKKIKNIGIKHITKTSSWRLESEADIDNAIDTLRNSLKEALNDNDIVNVEF